MIELMPQSHCGQKRVDRSNGCDFPGRISLMTAETWAVGPMSRCTESPRKIMLTATDRFSLWRTSGSVPIVAVTGRW